jgi:hypothetical protein
MPSLCLLPPCAFVVVPATRSVLQLVAAQLAANGVEFAPEAKREKHGLRAMPVSRLPLLNPEQRVL